MFSLDPCLYILGSSLMFSLDTCLYILGSSLMFSLDTSKFGALTDYFYLGLELMVISCPVSKKLEKYPRSTHIMIILQLQPSATQFSDDKIVCSQKNIIFYTRYEEVILTFGLRLSRYC